MVRVAHHPAMKHKESVKGNSLANTRVNRWWWWSRKSYPLLERLVDGIHGVPDGYPLEIPCCYVQPRLEVEVNLLDWRCCEHHLKVVLVVYRRRRGVDLPVIGQTSVSHVSRVYRGVRPRA